MICISLPLGGELFTAIGSDIQIMIQYITTNGWGTVHSRMTLAAFLEKMPDNFIRIHHSYVINTDYLMGVGYRECTVAGNVVLPVARGMQKTIEKYF